MKNLTAIVITLTAIGVAVKVGKKDSKKTNTNYYGFKEPVNPCKGDLWFKQTGELRKY